MSEKAVLSVVCVSRPGLLASVTQRVFDLGCNLADTTFAALAGTTEFTAICELPEGLARETLAVELQRLPELAGARVSVSAHAHRGDDGASRPITHRVEFSGADRPGTVLRLTETFAAGGAEVVRLNTHTASDAAGTRRILRFAVAIAADAADDCLASIADTAEQLDFECRIETA